MTRHPNDPPLPPEGDKVPPFGRRGSPGDRGKPTADEIRARIERAARPSNLYTNNQPLDPRDKPPVSRAHTAIHDGAVDKLMRGRDPWQTLRPPPKPQGLDAAHQQEIADSYRTPVTPVKRFTTGQEFIDERLPEMMGEWETPVAMLQHIIRMINAGKLDPQGIVVGIWEPLIEGGEVVGEATPIFSMDLTPLELCGLLAKLQRMST